MRALVYSCLAKILVNSDEMSGVLIRNQFSALPSMLLRDVMILPDLIMKDN